MSIAIASSTTATHNGTGLMAERMAMIRAARARITTMVNMGYLHVINAPLKETFR